MVVVSTAGVARTERDGDVWSGHEALPRADPTWVPRPALLEVLSQALRRRVTTVIAGPGCGKTTLLASWARTVPCAWYSVGPADSDGGVLVRGLAEALRVRLPELEDGSCVDSVAGALAGAVRGARGSDFALVIDDVQDLSPLGSSARLLASLCQQAPPMLHLVLSSRTHLPFSVQRLRGRGQVLELDPARLALSVADTEILLATVDQRGLPRGAAHSLAERVHELTGGWPAATRLTVEWLRDRWPGTRAELATLARPGGLLFGYVAEEVLDPSDATTRALLTEVAPLPCFTVELCQALGVDVGEAELARLARERLFVRPHPDRPGWFTLGPLIRDVALTRMHPDIRQRVRSRAMSWFTGNGYLAEAVSCALELGEPERGEFDRSRPGPGDHLAALAHALVTRGRARLGLGRLDAAIADFCSSRTVYQRIGSRDVVFSLLGLADAYRERGELALASSAYTEAITWAEPHNDDRVLVPARSGLARVLVGEDPRRAAMLAARAAEAAQGGSRVIALLAAGWVALECDGPEHALRWVIDAVEAAGARSDRATLAEALELRAAASPDRAVRRSCMREAATIWADIGNAVAAARNAVARARMAGASESEVAETERHLRALGVREPSAVAGLLRAVPTPIRPWVRVRTLGEFGILRDGVPVCVTEWNSKKARDLLKLLISRHGRPTPRELLIEMLWPAEDPARCANRLSVALSAIRTVLDPEHRYPPDHFVHSDKHVVRLANLRVDVEEFLAGAARVTNRALGVPALDELRVVEGLYSGDFLQEDPYEDWAVPLREQAREAYLAVARALADAAAAAGDDNLAVRLSLRILEFDRYDEDAHLRLTAALTSAGRHGQARVCYRNYQNRMAELGIKVGAFPSPAPRNQ